MELVPYMWLFYYGYLIIPLAIARYAFFCAFPSTYKIILLTFAIAGSTLHVQSCHLVMAIKIS